MKQILTILIFSVNNYYLLKVSSSKPCKNVRWELIWEDNFDINELPDENIWNYEEGYIRNIETQYYTKRRCENARVKNGKLINEAGKENGEVRVITLASLNTLGKRKMLYGSNEV